MKEKITSIRLQVPYKGAGNAISQHEVDFEVSLVEGHYSIVPQLDESERRIANLPEVLHFTFTNGRPLSSRGDRDGNFHIIQDVVAALQERKLL